MADYRKSLMDMTPEERAEVAPGAVISDDVEKPLSVKAADAAVSLATPIDSLVEVNKELEKENPDYVKIGMLAGLEAIGLLAPGAPKAAQAMIRKGAEMAQPKKTVKAYKLFTKGEDDKLYPLFVDADTEVPVGEYMKAVFPEYRFKAENGNFYVPSRGTAGKKGTGDSIKIPDQETRDMLIEAGFLKKGSKAKTIKAVAARPGWHAGDNPTAAHIGPEVKIDGKSYKIRGDDQVWAEVEMPADVDWQAIADSRAVLKKDGTPNVKTAHITDELPFGGYYRYKTNPNMQGNWLISGDMKVNRVLDRDEVNKLNAEAGVEDLPTEAELRQKLGKGFAAGGLAGEDMYQGVDDYQMAEMGAGMKEGGSVEKQTEAVFKSSRGYAEGGEVGEAPDTTVGVDPVSGNEIPMGSTAAEVRDDIPAQLSEGEYVVPADVVRFYGVKFFEDLRTEAKKGFMEMAENGRIGGEPVEADGMEIIEPEDDLPFDLMELQMMDDDEPVEMDAGGYLSKARSRAEQDKPINRFEQFLQWLIKDEDEYGENPIDRYAKEQEEKGIDWNFMGNAYERGQRKFNVGGMTPGVMFNPVGGGGMSGGFEIKEYVGPNGDSLFIQFMNGRPMSYIPQGYKPKGTTQEQAATGAVDTGSVQAGTGTSDGGSNDSPMSTTEAQQFVDEYQISGTDYASMSTEGLQSSIDKLGRGSKLMGTAAGLLGGPIIGTAASLGLGSANRNEAYDILDGIAYQLENNPTDAQKATLLKQQEQIQSYLQPEQKDDSPATSLLKGSGVFGGATSMYDQLDDYGGAVDTDIDGNRVVVGDGRVTFGDTWLGDLLGADGIAGVQGPSMTESIAGARRTATDWEDEGSAEAGAAQIQEEQTYAQQIESNPNMSQDDRDDIQQAATNDWVQATNAVNSLSGGDDHIALHQAIKAQSEASRQATAAIQANTRARNNDDDPSNDSPASGDGFCFLTTAIVDRRGEADDGPTLTKLRKFRDTYLRNMPTEVEKYYEVAPKIVAAIPENHNDWLWIGEQIDKSVAYIDAGLEDKAYGTYKAMVKRLESDWL